MMECLRSEIIVRTLAAERITLVEQRLEAARQDAEERKESFNAAGAWTAALVRALRGACQQ